MQMQMQMRLATLMELPLSNASPARQLERGDRDRNAATPSRVLGPEPFASMGIPTSKARCLRGFVPNFSSVLFSNVVSTVSAELVSTVVIPLG